MGQSIQEWTTADHIISNLGFLPQILVGPFLNTLPYMFNFTSMSVQRIRSDFVRK